MIGVGLVELESEVSTETEEIYCSGPGCYDGVRIWNDGGKTEAERCSDCKRSAPADEHLQPELLAKEISQSGLPARFADATYGGRSFDEVAPEVLQEWLAEICAKPREGGHCIFLCGSVGNGKTHLASDCLKRFVLTTGRNARYLTATALVEGERDARIFADRLDTRRKDRLEYLDQVLKFAGLVVLDEIKEGVSAAGMGYLEKFIDHRYQSGLPTVFISNYTFDAQTSYKGVPITKVFSPRIVDRLRSSLYCEFTGESRRGIKTPTKAEVSEYCFPKSILAQKDGELQILRWVTRNPIFEAIRRDQRKIAQDSDGNLLYEYGIPVDVGRGKPRVSRDIWQKGDRLIMSGPILNETDLKTYVVCMELLRQEHRRGNLGLSIKLDSQIIMTALGRKSNN